MWLSKILDLYWQLQEELRQINPHHPIFFQIFFLISLRHGLVILRIYYENLEIIKYYRAPWFRIKWKRMNNSHKIILLLHISQKIVYFVDFTYKYNLMQDAVYELY